MHKIFILMAPLLLLQFFERPASAESEARFPLWNGHETTDEYARRVHLSRSIAIQVGERKYIDFVLVPAASFTMGASKPDLPDKDECRRSSFVGEVIFSICGGLLLILLIAGYLRSKTSGFLPAFSLMYLVTFIVLAGFALFGAMKGWSAVEKERQVDSNYRAELKRYEDAAPAEKPSHSVILTKPFYVSQFLVTQETYVSIVGNNPSSFRGDKFPVENISWFDASEYCERLSAKSLRQVRLPTEAEWEFASRAGSTSSYNLGDSEEDLDLSAWYAMNSNARTHQVGLKRPNAFGVYDSIGNVSQYCSDWYGGDYYGQSELRDPHGPQEGDGRVVRGGNWDFSAIRCRVTFRYSYAPNARAPFIGLRLVLSVP